LFKTKPLSPTRHQKYETKIKHHLKMMRLQDFLTIEHTENAVSVHLNQGQLELSGHIFYMDSLGGETHCPVRMSNPYIKSWNWASTSSYKLTDAASHFSVDNIFAVIGKQFEEIQNQATKLGLEADPKDIFAAQLLSSWMLGYIPSFEELQPLLQKDLAPEWIRFFLVRQIPVAEASSYKDIPLEWAEELHKWTPAKDENR
jgi:hypothetical protein